MPSQTSGGLTKFSVSFDDELLSSVEQYGQRRDMKRSVALRDLVRRGLTDAQAEEELLRQRRQGRIRPAEIICQGLTDEELEEELARRRQDARSAGSSAA